MTTLSDQTTIDIAILSKDLAKFLITVILELIENHHLKTANENMKYLVSNNPELIRNADINKSDIDKFKHLAIEKNIKCYEIINENTELPTLKYSIKDEHLIVDIFKEIENGYEIDKTSFRDIIGEKINRIFNKNELNIDKEVLKNEINNEENYRNINSKEITDNLYSIYKETAKELDLDKLLDRDIFNNIGGLDKKTLEEIRKEVKKENKENKKEKTQDKIKDKNKEYGYEHER